MSSVLLSLSLGMFAFAQALTSLIHDCLECRRERSSSDILSWGAAISNCKSSANVWCVIECESLLADIGLIFVEKSIGPRTEACGTPECAQYVYRRAKYVKLHGLYYVSLFCVTIIVLFVKCIYETKRLRNTNIMQWDIYACLVECFQVETFFVRSYIERYKNVTYICNFLVRSCNASFLFDDRWFTNKLQPFVTKNNCHLVCFPHSV